MKKENEASKSEASTTTVRSEPIEPAAPVDRTVPTHRRQRRARERPAHGQPARPRGLTPTDPARHQTPWPDCADALATPRAG